MRNAEPADSPEIVQFAGCANAYVELLQALPCMPVRDLAHVLAESLVQLYLAALLLPTDPWPGEWRRWPGHDQVPFAESGGCMDRLHAALGKADTYYEVFDPYSPDDPLSEWNTGTMSISDDLANIYGDVKEGMNLLNRSTAKDATWRAVHQWRGSFTFHWGDHAVDALRALHRLAVRDDDDR